MGEKTGDFRPIGILRLSAWFHLLQNKTKKVYTQGVMVKSHIDPDIQETADMLRRSEEHAVERGIARMEVLHKRYIQAKQAGNTALAKKLRREFCQEAFMNVCIAASPKELLFPDPQLEAMMGEITQELGW